MKRLDASGLPPWANRLILFVRIIAYLVVIGVIASMCVVAYHFQETIGRPIQIISLLLFAVRLGELLVFAYVALALAQLLSFLFDDARPLGFLLRYADIGLYIWAALGLMSVVLGICFQYAINDQVVTHPWWHYWTISSSIISWVIRAVLLIVIGLVLRRVLPILDESRAVV